MEIERVESGIPGLDRLIEGGFVKGSSILLAGTTGTCKTIFACQFILHGLRNGENGVYLTLEQTENEILGDVAKFGWDKELKKYIEQGKFALASQAPTDIKDVADAALSLIKRVNAKRFVLDSMSIATLGWKVSTADVGKVRMELMDLIRMVENTGVTSIYIGEIPETEAKALSRLGVEEFIVDGIIVLHYLEYAAGGTPRSLIIRKMRRTNHGTDIYPLEITSKGLKVVAPKKGIVL
jgi:KaiC/GvpD/RAD55 family RecA-like ATPase